MITLDTCHALGCDEFIDPRYSIHGPGGEPVEACEEHGNPGCNGRPCMCPQHDGRVGDAPAMQAAARRKTPTGTRNPKTGGGVMAKRKSIGRAEFLYVRMAYLAQLREDGESPQESARIINVDPVQVTLLLDTFDNFKGPLPGESTGTRNARGGK